MSFLKDIQSIDTSKLNHVDTIVTTKDGKKVKESTGEIVRYNGKDFFVVDNTPDEALHKVIDGLFIGSQDASVNRNGLKEERITHILNVAIHCPNHFPKDFIYKNVEMYDTPDFDISTHFEECSSFIHHALSNDGYVLCHCNAGLSRSVTVVLAYLMKHHNMTLAGSLTVVQKNRPAAKPNIGFMEKLTAFETSLTSHESL